MPAAKLKPDYSTVTEQPQQGATRLQLAMLSTRYAWAAGQAAGKDVAEVACGAGLGLGLLARMARSVKAGDLDDTNCRMALETHAGREKIHICHMDALDLPFPDASVDLLLLFEAIYYLSDAPAFFEEARRVLRSGGTLLLATVNPQWTGFHPSPFSTRYFSADELRDALSRAGFAANLKAGFPERHSMLDWLVAKIRRLAVAARMIPSTMAGKAFLKRMFYGALKPIPRELQQGGGGAPLHPIGSGMNLSRYRTLYAEARKLR
jgi:ubiquinone/menaquinone biosynthesis C-methylase UbiE